MAWHRTCNCNVPTTLSMCICGWDGICSFSLSHTMSLDLVLLFVIIITILYNKKSLSQTPSSIRLCDHCGKPTTLRCSRCHDAHYCSPAHLALDWSNHKPRCRRKDGRPTLEALLFPVDADTPTIVKIPYTKEVDPDGLDGPHIYHDLDSRTLRRYLKGLEMKYVRKMGSHGPPLGRTLVVMYGSEFQVDGSPLNRCVASLTAGRMHIPWSGNVLVLREEGLITSERYQSAAMKDVAAMTRFFGEFDDFVPYAF
ncbi:hypothetical protein B0H10DRAFT_1252178 [Mycena sp. CBHHK59/15]|nr:hypothetical protein B0H10DRAFT_1252178 [Mycena sp. CBHHK59/15]